ncbi:MAG: ketopantoate reductase family protein [Candidatus Thorarchaeota archaeon]
MRIAIMGSGGVGGYFGGRLAKAGEEVVLIARGQHLQAIAKNGLQIKSPKGDFLVKPAVTSDPSELDPVDLVLFCVKGYDTTRAAELIRPIVSKETTVISIQNGVEKEEILGRIIGDEHLMGGLCTLSAYIEAPGIVKHLALERIAFGELDGSVSDRGKRILKVFDKAGVNASLSKNILAEEWEKFSFICALTGLCCITRLPVGPILQFEPTEKLYSDVMTEIIEIARWKDISMEDDVHKKLMTFSHGLDPEIRPSTYRDLINGKRIEIETMNGSVVRLGRLAKIPTPTNDFIYSCLSAINNVITEQESH